MNKCINCKYLKVDLSMPMPKHGFIRCGAFGDVDFVWTKITRNEKCSFFEQEFKDTINARIKLLDKKDNLNG